MGPSRFHCALQRHSIFMAVAMVVVASIKVMVEALAAVVIVGSAHIARSAADTTLRMKNATLLRPSMTQDVAMALHCHQVQADIRAKAALLEVSTTPLVTLRSTMQS
jgi:hypothetical protein